MHEAGNPICHPRTYWIRIERREPPKHVVSESGSAAVILAAAHSQKLPALNLRAQTGWRK